MEMLMLFVQETGLRLPERLKRWAASSAFPGFFTLFRDSVNEYPDERMQMAIEGDAGASDEKSSQ